jgi:hypothetical protein
MVVKTFAGSELGIGEGCFEAVKAGRCPLSIRFLQCRPQLGRGLFLDRRDDMVRECTEYMAFCQAAVLVPLYLVTLRFRRNWVFFERGIWRGARFGMIDFGVLRAYTLSDEDIPDLVAGKQLLDPHGLNNVVFCTLELFEVID